MAEQYTIKLEAEAERCITGAPQGKSIPSMIYYPKQMHNQEAFCYEE